MIRHSDPAVLTATAIVSIAVGFGAATLMPSRDAAHQPIINADAWEQASPSPVVAQPASIVNSAPRCSQWAISDVAMEEVLDEMIRRGWRPPTQGEAIAMLDDARTTGLSAVDPTAPMPYRGAWATNSTPGDEETSANSPTTGEASDEPEETEPSPPPA